MATRKKVAAPEAASNVVPFGAVVKKEEPSDPKELIALSQAGMALSAHSLGVLSDYWFEMRNKRLLADKVAADLKSKEDLAEATLIAQMLKQKISAAGGSRLRVGLPAEPKYKPTVVDWPAFYNYILETKDFSLLQKRPGEAAINERWEDNVKVPGVDKFPVYKLTRQEVK